jgi:hypothetical protein
MIRKLIFASMALLSSAASAAPSVFIPAGSSAWWTADNAQGRVIGTTAGGITAAQLSKFIESTEIFSPYKVCSLTTVANDTYIGLDKKTQDDIIQTLKAVHWRAEGITPAGKRIVAQSVLYEACDDPENRGAAVLVTDLQSSEVMMFERMGVFTTNSSPIWTAFLSKPERDDTDPPLFSYSHCTECGAATNVYYDVTRKKLYTEYNGH